MLWALKLQKLSVTWLSSNVESYIILVSISGYEVKKWSDVWTGFAKSEDAPQT